MGSFFFFPFLVYEAPEKRGAKGESPGLLTAQPVAAGLASRPLCSDGSSGKYILLIRALLLHVQRGCGAAGRKDGEAGVGVVVV